MRAMPVLLISGLVPEHLMEEIVEDELCRFLQKTLQAGANCTTLWMRLRQLPVKTA